MQEYEQAVFISYAWGGESEEVVDQIDGALQQRGLKIIRDKRDLGYRGSISAFMERIGGGNCVIAVISDEYLRSPNCMFELVEIAEGKQFHDRIFPIVLSSVEIYDPVKRIEYVRYWEGKLAELDRAMKQVGQANLQGIRDDIDLYDRIRDKVSGLTSILKDMNTLTPDLHRDSDFSEMYAGIERRMTEARGILQPETGESPYMGLRYFDTSDADLFYGREALTDELLRRVQKESFLAIVGASGSGKSSVARAGLIPAWKAAAMGAVYVITPTARPLESLAASLTRESESVTATSTLMDDLMQDARSLRLYVRKLLSSSGESNLLLVVDQFEETFTLCKDLTERKRFIENLLSLADEDTDRAAGHVVITLRADFYHHCAEYEGLRLALEKHQAYIGAMTSEELRQAILQPAERNGWELQPGLVDSILSDVGTEPGALPLLSHALLETWKRRQGRTLTLLGYHEAGGVKKAIAQTAESVYGELSPAEQTVARNIFLQLTELGEGVQDTRRRVNIEDLGQTREGEAVAKVLKTLTDARLVTTEQESAEVAHEALIREWGTLRKWLEEDRQSLRLHRQLTESAAEWERAGRDESLLVHRGGRLDDALRLKEDAFFGWSQTEQAYLNACLALRNRERREREQRFRLAIIASITVAVIFLVLGSFGLIKSNEATSRANDALTAQANANKQANVAGTAQAQAEEQAKIALARLLAAQAHLINTSRRSNEMLASLLAIQSMKLLPNAEGARFLLNNNHSGHPIARMTHDDHVTSVAFSPDGKYVVSGSSDGTARVWEAATGKEVARLTHDGTVSSVAFSPDGKYVVSGSSDGAARVWDARSGEEVARLTHDDHVTSVAFSPDGQYVVSGSSDGTARVWEAATGQKVARLTHDSYVYSVAFSPDGKYVVSGSQDDTARVWEAATGQEVARLAHDGTVHSVAFSLDGKYVVSGGDDNTARVWDARSGEEVARLTHDDTVYSVAFSPDGQYVVSGSWDRTARVWDARSGEEVARLTHDSYVYSVAFSPDGKYVVSGSLDGTARVWDAATGKEVARLTHDDTVSSVAFSPDGKYVVSGSWDRTARVWDARSGEEVARLTHDSDVSSVAFSPDGKYVVSGSRDFTARVWEAATGQEVARLTHDGTVSSVAFSLDGKYMVSGSSDGTARVWEAATGQEIARMTHDQSMSIRFLRVSVAFSLDGKYVVSGGDDNTARVWDARSGEEVARLTHDDHVTSVAFSPDGKYVVSGSWDRTARVWDAMSGEEVARMTHDTSVTSVAFSLDGKYVVSGSWDFTARVWDAMSGEEVARMNHDDTVTSVAFSPDGKYVVSGSWDRTARVWEFLPEDLIATACLYAPRNLTRAEWTTFIRDALPYQAVCPNLPVEP